MKLRLINTWDGFTYRLFALTRVVGKVGDGNGFSERYSLGLARCMFHVERGFYDFRFILFGLKFHWNRSYGGIHA